MMMDGGNSLPVAISIVAGRQVSYEADIAIVKYDKSEIAYLVISNNAFSPTFMVVTPSSQPIVCQHIVLRAYRDTPIPCIAYP